MAYQYTGNLLKQASNINYLSNTPGDLRHHRFQLLSTELSYAHQINFLINYNKYESTLHGMVFRNK